MNKGLRVCLVVAIAICARGAAAAPGDECDQCDAALAMFKESNVYLHYHNQSTEERKCAGVSEVYFYFQGRSGDTLRAVPHLAVLSEPARIEISLISIEAGKLHKLAQFADVINTMRRTFLSVDADEYTDADVKSITALSNVVTLQCRGRSMLTEVGFMQFTKMPMLENLTLGEPLTDTSLQISDASLRTLGRTTNLTRLTLGGANFTQQGFRHFTPGGLVKLFVVDSNLSDKQLDGVGALAGLEHVMLAGCPIDGSGLKHLSGLQKLRKLSLARTSVNDQSLAPLTRLPALEELSLYNCPNITDGCVESLGKMKQLKDLDLLRTQVTVTGLRKLQRLLPKTSILITRGTVQNERFPRDDLISGLNPSR